MMPQSTAATSDDGVVAAFARELREVHDRGKVPYRAMAQQARFSYTTLSRAAAGMVFPTWEVTRAFVEACGEDPAPWRVRWEATRQALLSPQSPKRASEPNPYGVETSEEFVRRLRSLKAYCGNPSYRQIARRAQLPPSTVADVFKTGRRGLPSWHLVERTLLVFGVQTMAWQQAWTALASLPAPSAPHDETRPLVHQALQLGLEGIYPNRAQALDAFVDPLEQEIRSGENGRLWIVGSSMKGLVQVVGMKFDGVSILSRALAVGCDVRMLCTNPTLADARAVQEGRQYGAIYQEILLNLVDLKLAGIKRENVRYYQGAPTVFGVCTSDRMLLNPYPYGSEAFRNFSIIVRKTPNSEIGIFDRYREKHFEQSWRDGKEIAAEEWDRYELSAEVPTPRRRTSRGADNGRS
jgi:hypothetical protein